MLQIGAQIDVIGHRVSIVYRSCYVMQLLSYFPHTAWTNYMYNHITYFFFYSAFYLVKEIVMKLTASLELPPQRNAPEPANWM